MTTCPICGHGTNYHDKDGCGGDDFCGCRLTEKQAEKLAVLLGDE